MAKEDWVGSEEENQSQALVSCVKLIRIFLAQQSCQTDCRSDLQSQVTSHQHPVATQRKIVTHT